MTSRKYSVSEIDQMRHLVGVKLDASYTDGSPMDNRLGIIEDMLRTYMLNGTEPSELVLDVYGKNTIVYGDIIK